MWPQDDLQPHSPMLLLFTTSAQTHIFPEIRIDAVKFLDLLLEVVPEGVVSGWTQTGGVQGHVHGSRVLEGYLGILNAGTSYGQEGGRSSVEPCKNYGTDVHAETGPVKATSTASVVLSPAVSSFAILRGAILNLT
jgi:pre-rRNA-processing protein IPI1